MLPLVQSLVSRSQTLPVRVWLRETMQLQLRPGIGAAKRPGNPAGLPFFSNATRARARDNVGGARLQDIYLATPCTVYVSYAQLLKFPRSPKQCVCRDSKNVKLPIGT